MFPFRSKRLDNVALAPPPPQETTIHNHSVSWPAIIAVSVACALLSMPVLWWFWVMLFAYLGAKNPEREAAFWAISILLAPSAAWLVKWLILSILSDFLDHRERMAEKLIELEIARTRTAQLLPPTTQARMTREESRQYQAIKLVMDKAYHGKLDEAGNLIGKVEPWSRRSVGQMTLFNEREPVGENSNLASFVKQYLLDNKVLISDRRVDLKHFPTLASVEAQLVKDFGQPIIFKAADYDAGMSTHYLDKGTKRESWG